MFIIITAGLLGGILALALVSVKFLLSDKSHKKFYLLFTVTDLLMIMIIVGGWIFRTFIPDWFITIFGDIATVFLLTQLFCGIFVICAIIVRAVYRKFSKPQKFDPQRRRLITHGIFYPLTSLALSLYGNQIEKNSDVENFYDVPIKNLPAELDGFKLAQISDIHLGAFFSLERLEKLLQRIADSKVELLAITGDIFDDVKMNSDAIKLVDKFTQKFPYGIYYIHGNHEHFRGIQTIEKLLSETKINWLVNESRHITSKLYIAGVDYPPRAPMMKADSEEQKNSFAEVRRKFVSEAMTNIPDDSIKILLAHHPEFIDDGAEKNFALTLTGHTHGSQFGFLGMPLFPVFKYTRGIVKIADTFGYVHVGNGSWFPFRIGCPPEIAYFTLKSN